MKKVFAASLVFLSMSTVVMPAVPVIPVIMVHGMLASGDTYAGQINRFADQGYPRQMLYTYDWNSLSFGRGNANDGLGNMVDSVLRYTGSNKVYLVGHSAGSGLVYTFCKDSIRSSKVAGVILIGGFRQDTTAGPGGIIPTMNIYSDGDLVAKGGADIPGAVNIHLKNEDHYEVATGINTFNAIYKFITGKEPVYKQEEPSWGVVSLSGKAVYLGENRPLAGGKVEIFQVSPTTGIRLHEKPDSIFTVDEFGQWGSFKTVKGACFEFVVQGKDSGDRPVHYFREQVKNSDFNIYLRAIPNSGLLSMMFKSLPEDSLPAIAVFSSSKAIANGRDYLLVDGDTLTGSDYFKPSRTTIAMFLFDGNRNGQSDHTAAGLFNLQGVFLAGIDMSFGFSPQPIRVELNNRFMSIRRIPSSEGISVIIFD